MKDDEPDFSNRDRYVYLWNDGKHQWYYDLQSLPNTYFSYEYLENKTEVGQKD